MFEEIEETEATVSDDTQAVEEETEKETPSENEESDEDDGEQA